MQINRDILAGILLTLMLVWSLLAYNVLEGVLGTATLFIAYLLFVVYKPSTFLFLASFSQWLSINIKVLYANAIDIDHKDVFSYYTAPEYLDQAFLYSSVGFIALIIFIFFSFRRPIKKDELVKVFSKYSFYKILIFYITYVFLIETLYQLRNVVPGLFQVIFSLGLLKWGIFAVIIAYAFLVDKKYVTIAILLSIFEFISGFYSYFSEFKSVVFYFLIGSTLILTDRIKIKYLLVGVLSGFFLIQIGLFWTTVKGDYREFLSQGERVQKVSVSSEEAFNKLIELYENTNSEVIEQSTEALIDRLGYLDFFALVIRNVPTYVNHTEGEIWFASFVHIITPRIFFPDKPAIDDSEHTRKYAGVMVATGSQGASHSIGYMADAFVDFGPIFMVLPIIIFAILSGVSYSRALYSTYNILYGIALSTPIFGLISVYGKNSIKLVSQLIMYLIVVYLINKFLVPKIDSFLLKAVTDKHL